MYTLTHTKKNKTMTLVADQLFDIEWPFCNGCILNNIKKGAQNFSVYSMMNLMELGGITLSFMSNWFIWI